MHACVRALLDDTIFFLFNRFRFNLILILNASFEGLSIKVCSQVCMEECDLLDHFTRVFMWDDVLSCVVLHTSLLVLKLFAVFVRNLTKRKACDLDNASFAA